MASKVEVDRTLKRLSGYYPQGIPPGVLADTLKVTEAEAVSLIAEYGTPPKPKRKYVKKAVAVAVEPTKPIKPKIDLRIFVQNGLVALLPFIFFGAAAVGAYRSFTLCYSFFARFNPADGALTMSILLVAVAFAMPQAVHILWPEFRKGKRIFIFLLCCLLSIASIGVNVVITAQELQNQKTDSQSTISEESGIKAKIIRQIDELVKQRNELLATKDREEREQDLYLTEQVGLKAGTAEYNRNVTNLTNIRKSITTINTNVGVLSTQIATLTKDIPVIIEEKSIETSPVDLTINWLGSILVEVGGPVALALSLCL
jgi:hypothetical protein